MAFYVYIIQSSIDSSYYKGFSEDPLTRLQCHNSGGSEYTRSKMPWSFVYIEQLASKREALIREKALKKYSHRQIQQLMLSAKNQLKDIIG